MYSQSAAQSIWRDVQASSWPFQSIHCHVPFYPQHGTAPSDVLFPGNRPSLLPLLLPVSALPSCPMASAPILGFTVAVCFPSPVGVSALPRCQKGVLARECDPARTLTHPDGLKWLERGQVKKKKEKKQTKKHISRTEGMNMERC